MPKHQKEYCVMFGLIPTDGQTSWKDCFEFLQKIYGFKDKLLNALIFDCSSSPGLHFISSSLYMYALWLGYIGMIHVRGKREDSSPHNNSLQLTSGIYQIWQLSPTLRGWKYVILELINILNRGTVNIFNNSTTHCNNCILYWCSKIKNWNMLESL